MENLLWKKWVGKVKAVCDELKQINLTNFDEKDAFKVK